MKYIGKILIFVMMSVNGAVWANQVPAQGTQAALTNKVSTERSQVMLNYQQALKMRKTHKFTDNQIRSFVYCWYGLHDVHADINKTYELLDKNKLLMIFPEITVRNLADYKKWYDGVGENIRSNIHIVRNIEVKFVADHQYQVNVLVTWQAMGAKNQFINVNAHQQWLLMDGDSDSHPYAQEYKVLDFKNVL